jgi:hypothetical protein
VALLLAGDRLAGQAQRLERADGADPVVRGDAARGGRVEALELCAQVLERARLERLAGAGVGLTSAISPPAKARA